MLIRRAEVGALGLVDVRVSGTRISALAECLSAHQGECSIDAAGGALLPGLCDHHLHLYALAAAEQSVSCGPPEVRSAAGLASALCAAARRQTPSQSFQPSGWVRGIGYHESVAGVLDRDALDRWLPDTPVRVQHRTGAAWHVNSRGLRELGLSGELDVQGVERDADGRATGRLFGLDGWLRERIGDRERPTLAATGRRLASFGVTGLTDATPANGPADLAAFVDAVETGALPQRVQVMGRSDLPRSTHPRVTRGAVKIRLEEDALPSLEELCRWIEEAHLEARTAAIHCVTRAELVVAAAAFAAAGAQPGDRIEHASVAPPDVVALLARLPLTVVTQPHFLAERGDEYARDVANVDRPWLYRCRGLLEDGVAIAGGTDAPFGHPDPWRVMAAAVDRRSSTGRIFDERERLSPEGALRLFTTPLSRPGGESRRVAVGSEADLCLLDRPWSDARRDLSSQAVAAVWCRGRLAWSRH